MLFEISIFLFLCFFKVNLYHTVSLRSLLDVKALTRTVKIVASVSGVYLPCISKAL